MPDGRGAGTARQVSGKDVRDAVHVGSDTYSRGVTMTPRIGRCAALFMIVLISGLAQPSLGAGGSLEELA